jgi:hypothetical protein
LRLVLDTTYLLPAVGVSVKDISSQDVLNTLGKTNETALCEISIFELCAKAAKYVASGKLDAERVSRGIQAIREDDSITKLPPYNRAQLSTAIKLREMLGDFIDCLILSTAINLADGLMTEDGSIHELKRNEGFRELLKSVNPKFEIRKL